MSSNIQKNNPGLIWAGLNTIYRSLDKVLVSLENQTQRKNQESCKYLKF